MSDLRHAPPRAKGNRVAVLCGIGRYREFPLLAKVAEEIEELRELLTTDLHPDFQFRLHGDTVYRDDQLTKEKLLKLLINLRESRNTELVFFYLAGHGHQHEGDTYFLTYDAAPPFLTNPGVRLGELRHYLNQLGALATVAVLDFCHAGAIPFQDLNHLSIFASSRSDQVSDAGGTSKSFTDRLIEAIRTAVPDEAGYVRWDRIADRTQLAHGTSLVAKPKYVAGTLGDLEFDYRLVPQDGCQLLTELRDCLSEAEWMLNRVTRCQAAMKAGEAWDNYKLAYADIRVFDLRSVAAIKQVFPPDSTLLTGWHIHDTTGSFTFASHVQDFEKKIGTLRSAVRTVERRSGSSSSTEG